MLSIEFLILRLPKDELANSYLVLRQSQDEVLCMLNRAFRFQRGDFLFRHSQPIAENDFVMFA
jgi:hypothetical protein